MPTDSMGVGGTLTASSTLQDTHQAVRLVPQPRATEQLARLIVLSGERAGRKITVSDELVLGRSRGVGLQLDDTQVSRRHSRVARGPDGWFLEDLASRNGTLLNGDEVKGQGALTFGDRIQVGESLLLFTHHDPLEEHILERQKLEAIGRLGTGIAHDFNNLLGAVHSSLDYLDRLGRERTLGEADVQACFADIRAAATRASEMTGRLLGFARRSTRSHSSVDLSALAAEVLKLLGRTVGKQITLAGDLGESLVVTGDRSHLHQLLMNLCINARDALSEGGVLTVRVRMAEEKDLEVLPFRDHGQYVVVRVEDDGIGMDEETKARLFEPFFTTKREGHGAGLGLATAYEVVDAHGGHIDVRSAVGEGTCFSVLLPVRIGSERQTSRRGPVTPLRQAGSDLSVLLVDDEPVMRRSVARLLRQIGHTVQQVEDGRAAVDYYASADPRPDVIVLDLDMPIMRGDEAFRLLREMDPDVCVVVASGYVDDALKLQLEDEGALAVLHKPFEIQTLQSILARVRPRE